MPGISIELNGHHVSTINLAGMEVVDVSVFGALDQNPKAVLHAMGGNYKEGGCGHLIWVPERALLSGDVLRVRLDEVCDLADPGRTIQELFPDEEPCSRTDFTISDQMAAEIRARPRLHERFEVQAETSHGQRVVVTSDDRSTCFRFGVLWDFARPSQARVYRATHCLDDVMARQVGIEHMGAVLAWGDDASFSLVS